MTKEQFDALTIVYGMMYDGCSKEEALTYLVFMDTPASIVVWVKNFMRKDNG